MSRCAAQRRANSSVYESSYQQGITMRVLGHLSCIQPRAGLQILQQQGFCIHIGCKQLSEVITASHPTHCLFSLLIAEVNHDGNEVTHVPVIINSGLQYQ